MGYYTDYDLEVRGIENVEKFEELKEAMRHTTASTGGTDEFDLLGYAFEKGSYDEERKEAEFLCCGECKWYYYDLDMLELSRKFPEMTFKLHGIGEEHYDEWEEFYKNGEMERCPVCATQTRPKNIFWEGPLAEYTPEEQFWIEQMELRDIKLKGKQKIEALKWLGHWLDDSWDMLSDAINAAVESVEKE